MYANSNITIDNIYNCDRHAIYNANMIKEHDKFI